LGKIAAILVIAFWSQLAVAFQASVKIGVLEDVAVPAHSERHVRGIRILFQSDGTDWRALATDCPDNDCSQTQPQKPRLTTWTIGSEGRAVAQVRSRTAIEPEVYFALGLEPLIEEAPGVRPVAVRYGGGQETPLMRPLIASSKSTVNDPDHWRVSLVPAEIAAAVRQAFAATYPKTESCGAADLGLHGTNEVHFAKAYSSSHSWHLVEAESDACVNDDEGQRRLRSQWFVVNGANEAEFVGERLRLIGAGDYDNDGMSEILFSSQRNQRKGYELFYDDFRCHVTLEFSKN
jgi:hypothetical protein